MCWLCLFNIISNFIIFIKTFLSKSVANYSDSVFVLVDCR